MTCLVRALVFCFSFHLIGLACLATKPTLHLTGGESDLLFASDGYLYTKATVQPHVKEKLLGEGAGGGKMKLSSSSRKVSAPCEIQTAKNTPPKTGQGHRSIFLCPALLGKKMWSELCREPGMMLLILCVNGDNRGLSQNSPTTVVRL